MNTFEWPYPGSTEPGDHLVLTWCDGRRERTRFGTVLADGAIRWQPMFCPRLRHTLARAAWRQLP